MTGQIIFDPLLPWAVLGMLAVLTATGVVLALWLGLAGWLWRGLAGVVILALSFAIFVNQGWPLSALARTRRGDSPDWAAMARISAS